MPVNLSNGVVYHQRILYEALSLGAKGEERIDTPFTPHPSLFALRSLHRHYSCQQVAHQHIRHRVFGEVIFEAIGADHQLATPDIALAN